MLSRLWRLGSVGWYVIAPLALKLSGLVRLPPLRLSGGVVMDLFQLETFLAVAKERSFSRAATRLHRTQPAVSQAIAKLEAELGEVLLERSSRDGTLTDAGEVLREYALKL